MSSRVAAKFLVLFEADRFQFLLQFMLKHGAPENRAETILQSVLQADPTAKPAKRKAGKYSEWVVRHFMEMEPDQQVRFIQDADWQAVNNSLKAYHQAKQRKKVPVEQTDINKAFAGQGDEAFRTLWDAAQGWIDSGEGQTKSERLSKDIEVLVDTGEWLMAVPHTWEALKTLGTHSRWCNVANENMFNRYFKQGPSVVITQKNGADAEKYQLHFPSKQYMDKQDRAVPLPKILDLCASSLGADIDYTDIPEGQKNEEVWQALRDGLINFLKSHYSMNPRIEKWFRVIDPSMKSNANMEGGFAEVILDLMNSYGGPEADNPLGLEFEDLRPPYIENITWSENRDGKFNLWLEHDDIQNVISAVAGNTGNGEIEDLVNEALEYELHDNYFIDSYGNELIRELDDDQLRYLGRYFWKEVKGCDGQGELRWGETHEGFSEEQRSEPIKWEDAHRDEGEYTFEEVCLSPTAQMLIDIMLNIEYIVEAEENLGRQRIEASEYTRYHVMHAAEYAYKDQMEEASRNLAIKEISGLTGLDFSYENEILESGMVHVNRDLLEALPQGLTLGTEVFIALAQLGIDRGEDANIDLDEIRDPRDVKHPSGDEFYWHLRSTLY